MPRHHRQRQLEEFDHEEHGPWHYVNEEAEQRYWALQDRIADIRRNFQRYRDQAEADRLDREYEELMAEAAALAKGNLMQTETDAIHSGVETRTIHVHSGHKRPKSFVKHPPIIMNDTYTAVISTTQGLQDGVLLSDIGSYGQFLDRSTKTPGSYAYPIVPWALYNDVGTSVGASGNLFSSQTPIGTKMILTHTTLNIVCRAFNQNSGGYVDIYVVQAKKRVTKLASTTAGQYVYRDAIAYWANNSELDGQGVARENNTAGSFGTTYFQHPFSRPYDSTAFKDQYKILKVHHLDLATAGEQTVNINLRMNMPIDYRKLLLDAYTPQGGLTNLQFTDLATATASLTENVIPYGLKNGGIEVFAVARGQLGIATGLPDITGFQVGFVINRKSHYGVLKVPDEQRSILRVGQSTLQVGGTSVNVPTSTDGQAVDLKMT